MCCRVDFRFSRKYLIFFCYQKRTKRFRFDLKSWKNALFYNTVVENQTGLVTSITIKTLNQNQHLF